MRLSWECHDQSQETNWRHCVTGPELLFFHKRKGILKIEQFVKMPRHSMGAACSYSLAPGKSIARYCWRKLSSNRGWLFLSFFFLIILRPVIINYSSFNLTSQLPTVVTLMKFSRQCSDLKNHYIASTQTPSVFCLSAKDVSPSSQESY